MVRFFRTDKLSALDLSIESGKDRTDISRGSGDPTSPVLHFVTKRDLRRVIQYTDRVKVALEVAEYLSEHEDELVKTVFKDGCTELERNDVETAVSNLRWCLKAISYSLLSENETVLSDLRSKRLSNLDVSALKCLTGNITYLKNCLDLEAEASALLNRYYDKLLGTIDELVRKQ